MKKLVCIICIFWFTSSLAQDVCHGKKVLLIEDGKCTGENLQLYFEENFTDTVLNQSKWFFTQPWANHSSKGFIHSLEYQTDGLNYRFVEDHLGLVVKKERFYASAIKYQDSSMLLADGLPNRRWWDYTAGMVYSKESFGHGKFEIRCKIPKGKGFWSVFWLFGENNEEIDVFEFWNEENIFGKFQEKKLTTECHMTTHGNRKMCLTAFRAEDFSKEFHTYTLVWSNNKIEWFFDGELKRTSYKFYTLTGQPIECTLINKWEPYILNQTYPLGRLHIGVSIGIQAGKNAPDDKTPFPSELLIDYIRYWKY